MALPTVDSRDLNMVRLAPEVRRILRQRAHQAAQREYAPILQADRAALAIPQQEYATSAAATRGAASMAENLLMNALGGLRGRGLSGSALQQTRSELNSRVGDASASVPFLLADAAAERAAGMTEARQQLAQDRGQMLSSSAANFNQLLKEARGAGATELEEQKDRARAEREDAEDATGGLDLSPESLKNAELTLKLALQEWAKNPEVEGPDGESIRLKELNPLRSDEDWARFASGLVSQGEGFGLAEINQIIEQLRPKVAERRQQNEHRGLLPQPGVPGAGTWAAD